ncbi:hypothetical protein QZH41_005779 [Actinostola sp. cb2023]|nr:hypothetical protein QZH41_005779 [Actinostola sp. cb2023]
MYSSCVLINIDFARSNSSSGICKKFRTTFEPILAQGNDEPTVGDIRYDEIHETTSSYSEIETLGIGVQNISLVHISMSSSVPDHCRVYALSDPNDPDYTTVCDHVHDDKCDRCSHLASVVTEIEQVVQEADCAVIDTKEELIYVVSQATQNIKAWKSHMLRSANQDQCRLDILENLDETSVLLVLDWAMKYLPRKYRESQSDWFAKRGISWHITVATRRAATGHMETITFVHIFEACNQDSNVVLAILNDVFRQLKCVMPQLQSVYLRQDNAGCYHCSLTMVTVRQVAKLNGLHLSRMDFSDPQGEKGSCDRKAGAIKRHMLVHLNSGHDIQTAAQMQDAIESFGGVPSVKVSVCTASATAKRPIKWEGVSFLNNIQYSEEGLKVWRAYNIGQGKDISSTKFPEQEQLTEMEILKARLKALEDQNQSTVPSILVKINSSALKLPQDFGKDQAYFKALFFSGDRGADLGNVKCPEILRFPHDDGLLFNHTWECCGKICRQVENVEGDNLQFSCKEHFDVLLAHHKAGNANALKKSGTEEEYGELQLLLDDILSFIDDLQKEQSSNKKKKQDEIDREKAKKLRNSAMSTLKQKSSPSSDSDEASDDTSPSKKGKWSTNFH